MLCSILLANYSGNFSWQNTGNGHGCFPLVNIANTDLLRSYMEKVHGRLEFLFVRTVYLSFCASGIKLCTPGCPVVYWLGYVCKCEASKHKSMCYCFFTRTKRRHTFTHDMQQSMSYCYIQRWPFEWPTLGPVQ